MLKPTDQELIAVEILTAIVDQIQTSMINDRSPLTDAGLLEMFKRIELANQLLSEP